LLFSDYHRGNDWSGDYCNFTKFVNFCPRDLWHHCWQFNSFPKLFYYFIKLVFAFEWFQFVLVSAKHAMSILYCFIDWHVTSRVRPVVDNSNPPTFWNRICTEPFVLFLSISPKGSLFSFFNFLVLWLMLWLVMKVWWEYLRRTG